MIPLRLRVLFSEDNQDTREMISILLDEVGIDVVCPKTAHEVLDLAKQEHFDAFVLDNWTPGLSGLDLCREIRKFNLHTPIIFYSAAAFAHDKAQALASGAQCYITKPGNVQALTGAIRSARKGKGL